MNARRSVVLDVGVRMVFHTILLFSLFLLFSGHNLPGGGFAGGLVAGAAFILRDVAAGAGMSVSGSLRPFRGLPVKPTSIIAIGLLVATATAMVPLLTGDTFFEAGSVKVDLPVFGDVKVVSALAFDIGVYLVVLGVVLTIVHRLNEDPGS